MSAVGEHGTGDTKNAAALTTDRDAAWLSLRLPTGTDATNVGGWETDDGVRTRLCWSVPAALPENLRHLDVRAVVEQRSDGTVVDGTSTVHLGEHGWSPSETRLIAEALREVADVADAMANTVEPGENPDDGPRASSVQDFGRFVLEEFGVISTYQPAEDNWWTLTIRLAGDGGTGLQIELGPGDLGQQQIRLLHRAISTWNKVHAQSRRPRG